MSVAALVTAAWIHFSGREDTPAGRRWWSHWRPYRWPLVAWLLVVFEVASLTLGMIGQCPAWSVGRSNLQALTGKTCGLADDVLVESDPNAGMQPVGVPVAEALGAVSAEGFTPQRHSHRHLHSDRAARQRELRRSRGGRLRQRVGSRGGHRGRRPGNPWVNGSRAPLPYGLDPTTTLVLGGWRSGTQQPARLRSAWYRLPARDALGDDSAPWW